MVLIDRTETNPFFNIAAEEYVLKELRDDVFMLWINAPSVIIGKHQVAAAEADLVYTHANNIPVIRRISGGGTVYHDPGNLNYSLILKGERGKLVDYKKYTGMVIRALAKKGIRAELHGVSNLVTGGLKFSGNAEHVFRDRVLHHGTLLFSTDLTVLRSCIRPDHRDYVDRSIRSNDSSITNLSDLLPQGTEMSEFRELLIRQVMEENPGVIPRPFSRDDIAAINVLADEKYRTDEWNFSYSPRYELHKKIKLGGRAIDLEIKTEKGMIREISFTENNNSILGNISKALINVLHHPKNIQEALQTVKMEVETGNVSADQMIRSLF